MSAKSSEGVQVGYSCQADLESIERSPNIYTTRKDCQSLKDRIFELIEAEQREKYWTTLASFLHGQCSKQEFDETMNQCLCSTETKLLHNELIRSILYNAHFSMVPPPNVTIEKHTVHLQGIVPPNLSSLGNPRNSFSSYSASDMRHLPSISQLTQRVEVLLNERNLKIEDKAIKTLFNELKKFIMFLLENSSNLITKNMDSQKSVVTHAHLMYILNSDQILSRFVSPSLISKYSTL